jgi:hypothetical protein
MANQSIRSLFNIKTIAWSDVFAQRLGVASPLVAEVVSACHDEFVFVSAEGTKICIKCGISEGYWAVMG